MSNATATTISLLSVPNPVVFLKTLPAISVTFNSNNCALTSDQITKCVVHGDNFNDFYASIKETCNNCDVVYNSMLNECGLDTNLKQVLSEYRNNVCVRSNDVKCYESQWTKYLENNEVDLGSYKSSAQLSYTCDGCTFNSVLAAITYSKLVEKLFSMKDYGESQIAAIKSNIINQCGAPYDQLGAAKTVSNATVNWTIIVLPIIASIFLFALLYLSYKFYKSYRSKQFIRASNERLNVENYYISDVYQ
eukprot:NODE_144_length_17694_cov_0.489741.p7 type:complete len:249 gc:universal NODE_144_length_17694_cov_0.489741:6591-7337(+)